jgi:hypothetical protein
MSIRHRCRWRNCLIFRRLDEAPVGDWTGGANRDRTDDLKLAKLALSQLSYGPVVVEIVVEVVGLGRLELPTSRLSSARSNQLSYKPDEASSAAHGLVPMHATEKEGKRGRRQGANCLVTMLGWRELSETSILRKEVIQPQVPLRLPCYDFGPVADPTVAGCLPCGLAHRLKVEPTPMP